MTIHTKWMELLRSEASEAFQYGELTTAVGASFIDGQIKLMISESVKTWADFIYSKFTSTIMRHFLVYGCTTVVLSFDDKRFVPKAKAITQCKRRSGVQIIEFGESNTLPNDLPTQWKESIMNPWFKHRVIELICTNVPRLVSPPKGCSLIVDWETTREYVYGDTDEPEIKDLGCAGIGEVIFFSIPQKQLKKLTLKQADLKFTRWMRSLQCPMLIEATDGDYIPIALGLKAAGFALPVVILKAWKEGKGPEFVHIDTIHAFLQARFRRAARGRECCPWWEVKLFIVLLGLSGTDFTRNLPLVSPQKIWGALPLIIQTFDMQGPAAINPKQGKRIVELLYAEAFPKHIDAFSRGSVWSQAQASKLGPRNKALIPTDGRIVCTMRNINFLLEYWLVFEPPERIEEFGFRVGAGGVVEWDD